MQLIIDDRIEKINEQKFYYTNQLKELYRNLLIKMMQPKNKTKIKGILITGKPDAGKTTGINQFKVVYTANMENAREEELLFFQVPPRLHAKGVFHKLCQELKIADIPQASGKNTSIYYVDKAAKKIGDWYKALFIDEIQNLFLLSGESRTEILELFNRLINVARIPIFLVGVEGVHEILFRLEHDVADLKGTFSSRFPEFKLRPFTKSHDDELLSLLISIDSDLHLEHSDHQWYKNDIIRKEILSLTNGLIGKIVELMRHTAINAIESGINVINIDIIRKTGFEMGYSASK